MVESVCKHIVINASYKQIREKIKEAEEELFLKYSVVGHYALVKMESWKLQSFQKTNGSPNQVNICMNFDVIVEHDLDFKDSNQ